MYSAKTGFPIPVSARFLPFSFFTNCLPKQGFCSALRNFAASGLSYFDSAALGYMHALL
jgi:hypothetical protein